MLNKTYYLPDDLREAFRRPYGTVHTSVEEIKSKIKGKKVIAVGDIIGYHLIRSDINPDVVVFDGKQARGRVDKKIIDVLESFDAVRFETKNPPGCVTGDLWKTVKKSLESKKRVKIFVDGEEDLAMMPFVMEAKEGTIILYGLMDLGFVLIDVNKDLKRQCKEFLSLMEGR